MTAQIIDGKALAAQFRSEIKTRLEALKDKGVPALAVILVGNNPASQVYVRNKIKACADVGIKSLEYRLDETTSETEVLSLIEELNNNPEVDGILVQLPVPKQIDSLKIIQAISPDKDVDGFHTISAGRLLTGQKGFLPCTPAGVMKMIESVGYDLTGKEAVVVGRSNIVGKPQALLLLQKNATVTVAHSRTVDLASVTRRADVLIAAVGRAKLIKSHMIKPGALVIDVGMNRDENGKLCGDVDTEAAKEVASYISPVPGGVGPMTIAMLMSNTMISFENRLRGIR